MSDPANADRLAAIEGDGEELSEARQRQAAICAELDELADQVGRGRISVTLAARAEPGILARLQEIDRWVEDLTPPSPLRGLLGAGDDIMERWRTAPMSAKRQVARALFMPTNIGELRVKRATLHGRIGEPAADRIVLRTS